MRSFLLFIKLNTLWRYPKCCVWYFSLASLAIKQTLASYPTLPFLQFLALQGSRYVKWTVAMSCAPKSPALAVVNELFGLTLSVPN
jgi:hypothetical protein